MGLVRGQIRKGDEVIIDDIEIYLHIETTGPCKSWNGHFDSEDVGPDLMSGQFHLVLEDGREGDFSITNISTGSDSIPSVDFQGTGPLACATQ